MTLCDHNYHLVKEDKNPKGKWEYKFVCDKCGEMKWIKGK